MYSKKVLCFGELLVRYQSLAEDGLFQEKKATLQCYPGGSEANVAVALAKLQVPCAYMTAMPDTMMTRGIRRLLDNYGIDTHPILLQGERLGGYYLLSANGLTKGEVIYDRKYSAFSLLKPQEIDWDTALENIDWFHFSALTPALSADMARVCLEALQAAKRKNITISVDLNYRNRLWQYGKLPVEVMPEMLQYADVIMGNIWAANTMMDTPLRDGLDRNTPKEELVQASTESANAIFAAYPNCKHVANTFRFMDSATHNLFFGAYHQPNAVAISQTEETYAVVDRIGSGDAFMAGLIKGIRAGYNPQEIVDIATKTGFDKLFIAGDF
ncbi:PfkB family carbohydrate kinase [Sphingobacterium sp. Mn56C]|uniref:PfkB family carbohydrate kinase n=1 Tax=Sphingobacterium sp. Mn56C TaxID=3395261 RepID=UPI003BC806B5